MSTLRRGRDLLHYGVDFVEPKSSNSPLDWYGICKGWFHFHLVGAIIDRPKGNNANRYH